MSDQSAGQKGRTLRMQLPPIIMPKWFDASRLMPIPPAPQPGPAAAEGQPRSLKRTLLGPPALSPPAHKQEQIDSEELWASTGLPPIRKQKGKPEEQAPPEEIFDRLWQFRRNMHPSNIEMLDFVILQMEAELRSLRSTERLQPICSGGRAFLDAEKPIAESIGKIRDEVYRRFGEDNRLEPFLEHFVDAVLSSAPLSESEGKSDTELRNGFYRAVAWCLCTHNNHEQFIRYVSKNHISLIDGLGIAAGLSTTDTIGSDFSRTIISMLLEKRWVSLAFYHLQDMLRRDVAEMQKAKEAGGDIDKATERAFASMDILFMVFFREVERYQALSQKYTRLAMTISNFAESREKEVPMMYIDDSSFYTLVTTRNMPVSRLWSDLGHTHKFIAERLASKKSGEKHYVVGLRPRDIAQMFFTILEGVEFLTSDPAIKRLALGMLEQFHVPFPESPGCKDSFKKLVSISLFTDKQDLEAHARLFHSLSDMNDPIVSQRASDHREELLNKKESAPKHASVDPFEGLGEDEFF